MKKMNKKSKEGIKRKIASFSLMAMLLNAVMAGVLIPSGDVLRAEDQMCEAAIDVVMIIDRSGSMDNDGVDPAQPLTDAQNAANSFLGNLKSGDQSALVSYASEASLDKELSNAHTPVSGLTASGGTNIGDAIVEGTTELNSGRANNQAVKVMILLTDGEPTCPLYNPIYGKCGYNDEEYILKNIVYAKEKATAAADLGYKIFTIGLGNKINTDMLQEIADITGAEYHHAPTSADLTRIYTEISQQLCQYGSISGYK